MSYSTILFDIDGTLLDPGDSITESARYALGKFGVTEVSDEDLRKFVGPPLEHSFADYYDFDENQIKDAVKYFREKLTYDGIELYKAYDNMLELLKTLSDTGKTLGVVTSKIDHIAETVLKNANMRNYFQVVCAQSPTSVVQKDEILAEALQRLKINDKSTVVMVGDRKHDIDAANAHGIDSVGILHGYGNRNEFESSGSTYIVKDSKALADLLISS